MVVTTTVAEERNMVTGIEDNIGKRVFFIEGFIDSTKPIPKIFKSSISNVPKGAKSFKLKLITIVGEKVDKGSFMLYGFPCKIVRHRALIFEIIPDLEVSKPLRQIDELYFWNYETKEWIDAINTTKILEEKYSSKISGKSKKWKELSEDLKKLGISNYCIRKLFKDFTYTEIEDIILWIAYLNENKISKAHALKILNRANSRKYISDCLDRPCKYLNSAKKALELYVEE